MMKSWTGPAALNSTSTTDMAGPLLLQPHLFSLKRVLVSCPYTCSQSAMQRRRCIVLIQLSIVPDSATVQTTQASFSTPRCGTVAEVHLTFLVMSQSRWPRTIHQPSSTQTTYTYQHPPAKCKISGKLFGRSKHLLRIQFSAWPVQLETEYCGAKTMNLYFQMSGNFQPQYLEMDSFDFGLF